MKYAIEHGVWRRGDELGGLALQLHHLNPAYKPVISAGYPGFDGFYLNTDIPIDESDMNKLDFNASDITEIE